MADTINRSQNLTKDFTVLRLHSDTGLLIAGSLATFLLLYVIYSVVLWKRSRMLRAREEAENGPCTVWAGQGRVVRSVPLRLQARKSLRLRRGHALSWAARGG